MMNGQDLVRLERNGNTARLVLNRPEVSNALSLPTLRQLRELCSQVAADPTVWVVELTGEGGGAFCAGADLKERKGMTSEQVQEFLAEARAAADDLAALPAPTVAIINGAAFGGGCELALACDLRVIDGAATIGLTETSLAIIPGAGGTQRLLRLVGPAKAKEWILMARRLTAEEALMGGLVHWASEPGAVAELGAELVGQLLQNGPLALRAAKAAIDGGADLPLADGLAHENACYLTLLDTYDRVEALAAFAERRPPRFEGR